MLNTYKKNIGQNLPNRPSTFLAAIFSTVLLFAELAFAEPVFVTPSNRPSSDGEVLIYSTISGALMGSIYSSNSTGIVQGLTAGPDGMIYASLFDSGPNDNGRIIRIDPTSATSSVFVPVGSGGMKVPKGLRFGPDGHLYVVADKSGEIFRFDGKTGAFKDVFADGFGNPQDLVFGPDGKIYVTTTRNGVLRFDATTGSFIDRFIAPRLAPSEQLFVGLAFANNGDLLVAGFGVSTDSVSRYDPATGALIAEYTDFGPSAVDSDTFDVMIGPDEEIYVAVRRNVANGGTDIVRLSGVSGAFDSIFANVSGVFGTGIFIIDNDCSNLALASAATKCFSSEPVAVEIDIKPGSDRNAVNPRSKGAIPVAVLGAADFDVMQVDSTTVVFGPDGASPVHIGHFEDLNDDGIIDLVLDFKTQDTGIACGDAEATLSGTALDDLPFNGTDAVKTVGCK